jgi:formate/nitrite transporter FocA (FNT family)
MSTVQYFVIAAFACIVYFLGAAFFHLFRDRGNTDKTVRALTFRIGFSIALFIVLIVLHQAGLIDSP